MDETDELECPRITMTRLQGEVLRDLSRASLHFDSKLVPQPVADFLVCLRKGDGAQRFLAELRRRGWLKKVGECYSPSHGLILNIGSLTGPSGDVVSKETIQEVCCGWKRDPQLLDLSIPLPKTTPQTNSTCNTEALREALLRNRGERVTPYRWICIAANHLLVERLFGGPLPSNLSSAVLTASMPNMRTPTQVRGIMAKEHALFERLQGEGGNNDHLWRVRAETMEAVGLREEPTLTQAQALVLIADYADFLLSTKPTTTSTSSNNSRPL